MTQDMSFYGRRILFIGAHPDDIELGCGALIHHIAPQTQILCVTLSNNQKNPLLTKLVGEHYNSMAVLGVPRENAILAISARGQKQWFDKYRGIANNFIAAQGHDFSALSKAWDEANAGREKTFHRPD